MLAFKNSAEAAINSGVLDSVKIGRARRITVKSIKKLAAEGMPPKPPRPRITRPT